MTSEKNKLAAILILAAALRLAGVNYGLPELYHQDEPIMVNHAMAIGASGGNPHFFIIGSFGLYALFLLYALYFFTGRLTGVFADPQAFASAFLSDPGPFYLLGRLLLGVAFGTATVWAVYRIGKKRFSAKAGLWGALFLAVLPMHVQHSHYIYADIPLALAVLLLLDALKDLMEEPSYSRYGRAGALGGWAMSVKYTALYFLPAALAAHFLAGRAARPVSWARLGAGLAAAAGMFLVLSPYALLAWTEFYSQVSQQTGAEHPVGWTHHLVYSILGGSGFLFLGLAVYGFLSARRHDSRLWAVWGVAVSAYYAVNVYFGQPFARYMVPLVPLLALWAGLGAERVFGGAKLPRVLAGALAAAVVMEMAVVSLYSDLLFTRTDTRVLCREWVEKNIPAGSVIAVDNRFFAPRLRQNDSQLREKYALLGEGKKDAIRRLRLDLELAASARSPVYSIFVLRPSDRAGLAPKFLFDGPYAAADEESLQRLGAQYLILDYTGMTPEISRLKIGMGERLEKLALFSPYRGQGFKKPLDPHASTAAPHLPDELFARERLGPALKVYRIRP